MRGDITIGSGRIGTAAGYCGCKPVHRDCCPPQGGYFRARWSNYHWDELHTGGRNNYCQPVSYDVANQFLKYRSSRFRKKEIMRIGDDNLFEIGCRKSSPFYQHRSVLMVTPGVECPFVGDFNTVSTRSRLHHTVRLSSCCVIGAGCLVVPTEDELLPEYTVIYGTNCERSTWSGRGKLQEADLRRKHAEYLREMLPKFNRLRRSE